MHELFEAAELVEAQEAVAQDRVRVVPAGGSVVLIVADGSGGIGDGGAAADFVVDELERFARSSDGTRDEGAWGRALDSIDKRLYQLGLGQSTAVVVEMSGGLVIGSAVGDSQAWLISEKQHKMITQGARRKPLLGTGEAIAACFCVRHENATLLIATDGLFNYCQGETIRRIVRSSEPQTAARMLVDAARMLSGGLQDDVGLILCRPGEAIRAHIRAGIATRYSPARSAAASSASRRSPRVRFSSGSVRKGLPCALAAALTLSSVRLQGTRSRRRS